jgi:hypothetical protein
MPARIRLRHLLTGLALLIVGVSWAQTLNPQAQAEVLQGDIGKAARAKDYPRVIRLIEQYKSARFPWDNAYYYSEAVAAYNTHQSQLAKTAVMAYLNSPFPQEYHEEAIALYQTLEEARNNQHQQESTIHWDSPEGPTAVRHGYAQGAEGRFRVMGFTLRCEIWVATDVASWTPLPTIEESAMYQAGRDSGARAWRRSTFTMTLHSLEPVGTTNATYGRPPWQGYYVFTGDTGHWAPIVTQADTRVVLFEYRTDPLTRTSIDGFRRGIGRGVSEEILSVSDKLSIDLAAFRIYQDIEPRFTNYRYCSQAATSECAGFLSGFREGTDAKPPRCLRISYLPPRDPEP